MAKHWNPYGGGGHSGAWERQAPSVTLQSLRNPAKYWIVSDAQLKRDLKRRTIKDVYRENRALRGPERSYVARWETATEYGGGLDCHRRTWHEKNAKPMSLRDEYLADCAARGHVPHPASIDSDHPQNCHREKAPKVERITGEAYAVGGNGAVPYPEAMAMAKAIHSQTGVFASIEQVL